MRCYHKRKQPRGFAKTRSMTEFHAPNSVMLRRLSRLGEIEKYIIRQPPIGEKDESWPFFSGAWLTVSEGSPLYCNRINFRTLGGISWRTIQKCREIQIHASVCLLLAEAHPQPLSSLLEFTIWEVLFSNLTSGSDSWRVSWRVTRDSLLWWRATRGVVKCWEYGGKIRKKWVLSLSREYWVYFDITWKRSSEFEFWGGVGGKPKIVAKPDPSVSNSALESIFQMNVGLHFTTWKLGLLNISKYLARYGITPVAGLNLLPEKVSRCSELSSEWGVGDRLKRTKQKPRRSFNNYFSIFVKFVSPNGP